VATIGRRQSLTMQTVTLRVTAMSIKFAAVMVSTRRAPTSPSSAILHVGTAIPRTHQVRTSTLASWASTVSDATPKAPIPVRSMFNPSPTTLWPDVCKLVKATCTLVWNMVVNASAETRWQLAL
jgi:hypothetical protein